MRESQVTIEHVARGADEMRAFGARLARALLTAPAHEALLVTLSGDLGAGKTTLVGGLLLGWGLLCRRDGERISEPEEPR